MISTAGLGLHNTVPLGPAAGAPLPAKSDAVPLAIEIPIVPVPEHEERVTVRLAVPVPVTALAHEAPPVVFSVTLAAVRLTASAPV
jgi:hypothetical protein